MKIRSAVLAVFSLIAFGSTASAAPLYTVTHDYGSGGGKYAPPSSGAGTCDTLNADSVTVRDSSGCQRFYDSFDFSAASYTSITSIDLQLTFDSTNQTYLNIFPEDWRVRPAVSATTATTTGSEMPALTRSGPTVTQTFSFNSSNLGIFNTIVANENFFLWFAENAVGANNFNLDKAVLTINGEGPTSNVPEPTSIALLGLGLLGAARARRRK